MLQSLIIYSEDDDKEVINFNCLNNENDLQSFDRKILGFYNRITDHTSDYVSSRILLEMNYIGAQIQQLWHKYLEFIRFFPSQFNFILETEYFVKYKEE
jgi:hypothetical protein